MTTISFGTKVTGNLAPSKSSQGKTNSHGLLSRLKLAKKSFKVFPLEAGKQKREHKQGWRETMSEELAETDSVDYMETDLSPSRNGEPGACSSLEVTCVAWLHNEDYCALYGTPFEL